VAEEEGFFALPSGCFRFEWKPVHCSKDWCSANVLFEQYVQTQPERELRDHDRGCASGRSWKAGDTIGSNCSSPSRKQELLEIFDPVDRLTRVADMLDIEIEKLNVDRTIQGRVKRQMERPKRVLLNERSRRSKRVGRGEKSEIDELRRRSKKPA